MTDMAPNPGGSFYHDTAHMRDIMVIYKGDKGDNHTWCIPAVTTENDIFVILHCSRVLVQFESCWDGAIISGVLTSTMGSLTRLQLGTSPLPQPHPRLL